MLLAEIERLRTENEKLLLAGSQHELLRAHGVPLSEGYSSSLSHREFYAKRLPVEVPDIRSKLEDRV